MATFKSDLVTKSETNRISTGIRDGDDANGKLTLATAHVTLTGSTAAADILQIIPAQSLPLGAVVIPQLSSVTCSDPGTTLTLNVGFTADPDAYAAGIVLSAGGKIDFTSGTKPAAVSTPVRIEGEADAIFATVATASTITNGTVLTFVIAYRSK
jgi:hypothetical protein